MMNSKELRVKAWNSLKGKYSTAFWACILASIVASVGAFVEIAAFLLTPSEGVTAVLQGDVQYVLSHMQDISYEVVAVPVLVAMAFSLLYSIFVSSPLEVGYNSFFIENTTGKPGASKIFAGFKSGYGTNVKTMLLMVVKVALWMLLFIIPGIIKSFEYAMVPYILADNPGISSSEAFAKSRAMMNGNKWRLFKLNFSFIGWELLCMLTLGIGAFFLIPYVAAANAEFYAELKNKE